MFKALLALALIVPAAAVAYDGEFPEYYPPTTEAPRGCIEGKVEIFLEGAEQTTPVYYVCKNGAFRPVHGKAVKAVTKHMGCREGQTEVWSEGVENSGPVTYVCKKGRFIRAN